MGNHSRFTPPPTRDELTQAEYVAWMLQGTTNVRVTEHAVYAFGAEAWVCPRCLRPNHPMREGKMPIVPTACKRCHTRLL